MDQPVPNIPQVLIIDDEQLVREAIIDILDLVEIRAITAENGAEGIKIFKAQVEHIRLIILDLSMPGLSGEETFLSIRQINRTIPILISTGLSKSESPPVCQQDSYSEFLQKPFSLDFLIERVEFHLSNST